ncbi:MAG: prephenate dehydrogenase/arogenate dehydrogenase family protein [Candidatus Bathyarchaeia archaeon]
MLIAVIGGAGRMGAWFAKYFLEHGHDIIISDIRSDKAEVIAKSLGVMLARNNVEAARAADLIFVSTPIDVAPKVLEELSHEIREDAIIAEISSLKSRVLPVLRDVAKRGIKVLSLHPLFGSGARGMDGERIALIPVYNREFEGELAKSLFPEARIIIVDREMHDRVMALTLALTHFVNIAFASVLGDENIGVLKNLGGTTFTLQLVISEAVMSEEPSLYASIQMDNEYTIIYLEKFMEKVTKLKGIIEGGDKGGFIKFYEETRNMLSKDEDFALAYERMYRALKAI